MEQSPKPLGAILEALQSNNHYGKSKEIDFAKGSHKYPTTLRDGFKILLRRWLSRKL